MIESVPPATQAGSSLSAYVGSQRNRPPSTPVAKNITSAIPSTSGRRRSVRTSARSRGSSSVSTAGSSSVQTITPRASTSAPRIQYASRQLAVATVATTSSGASAAPIAHVMS
jgi:hypothetical protein